MGDFAPTVLLAVAGGYAFLQLCPRTNHRWHALEWERNFFEATAAGAILFVLARAIVFFMEPIGLFHDSREWAKGALPFPYSGSLVATLALGVGLGLTSRLFFRQEAAIHSVVRDYGGELFKILLDSFQSRFLVSITLKNRKVYVGQIIASPSLKTRHLYTQILPYVSGYRDESTYKMQLTTPYWHVYEDLRRRTTAGEELEVDPDAFGIVLPLQEIVSINRFDPASYVQYFSSQTKDPPGDDFRFE